MGFRPAPAPSESTLGEHFPPAGNAPPMPPARRGISRFIVMAILQAERARRLGLPTESADSFGLNRAIFYAAAKAGFRSAGAERPTGEPKARGREPTAYPVGDDVA